MASSSQGGNRGGEGSRRGVQTYYSCKLSGHYARDCGQYWKEKFEAQGGRASEDQSSDARVQQYRGRSSSPVRRRWEPAQRSPSTDSRRNDRRERRDDVSELVGLLMVEREEKQSREKEEQERARMEKQKRGKEAKRRKKEERKRIEQKENEERLARIVDIQFSKRWGGAREDRGANSSPEYKKCRRRLRRANRRAKHGRRCTHSESDNEEEIAAIRGRTEELTLTDKRKRATTTEEDSSLSSLANTPLQRSRRGLPPRTARSAKKMKTILQPITLKRLREKGDPGVKGAAAKVGAGARQQFVNETIRHLDNLDYRQVQKMCKHAGVPYIRKGQVVAALAEERARVAYEVSHVGSVENPRGHAQRVVTKNEQTSRRVDRWMACTNQPFNMVENEFFLDMVNTIREAHPSWKLHSREEARNGRLNGQHQRAVDNVGRLAKKWARTGCMVQVDGWSDRRGRPQVNVMVSSPIGTVFWKSVAGKDKDASAYYKILTTSIEEIDPRSVVGVIMDNVRVCVKAGKLVEKKYPWIFRVGCTSHALDLALKDMDKRIPWFAKTVKRGNVLGKFVMNHDKVRALFLTKSNGVQIKKPGVTRFATNIIMLQSLWDRRNALKLTVAASGGVEKALRTTDPIVTLLKLVDGPGATVAKVYHRMDCVVESIRKLDILTDFEKAEVESILMERWAFMTSELHCAAAFLDPEYRSQGSFKDTEIRAGFNIWLYTWCTNEMFDDMSWQVDEWVNLRGGLESEEALCAARTKTPAMWWDAFGSRLHLLQPQAIRLLGQASFSAACKRNWSLHELVFGRRRRKLMPTRLSKLVYNNWNLHLQWRQEHGCGVDDVRISWVEEMPDAELKEEAEQFYNEWVKRVTNSTPSGENDASKEEDESEDNGDGEEVPMARRWLRNDEVDNAMDQEEGLAHIDKYTNDWHFNTRPGRQLERALRRLSGHQRPAPEVRYNKDRELALRARETGDWVEGRKEDGSSRQRKVWCGDECRRDGKHVAEEVIAPPEKRRRGRLTNKEVAARKAAMRAEKRKAAVEALRKKKTAAKKKAAAKTRKRDDIIDDDSTEACSSSSNSSEEGDDEDHDPIDGEPRSAEEGTEH
ncbi:hypothetical protein CBR_g27867 [Chara braunii]|uniref:DUF659 domain-containing protein n=1 Tax=Chara braunii TaxID=69332 RepID=A0A388L8K2_CHABU|nr:hypothetical protein CBR_g27867 [Chara braunii]|eukprot:GBG78641.1 hypothetical protein CBR_g27867 [Chara braunii]